MREISRCGAASAIELGVASGYSSAVIFSARAKNTSNPELIAFDLATHCYYDKTHKTGDAFHEMLGKRPGYSLKTGIDASQIKYFGTVDFSVH